MWICKSNTDYTFTFFQLFKSLHVQVEMRRKQVEGALQSTQKDGMLTVDQALVKQAWERASNRVRAAGEYKPPQKFPA